MSRDAVVTTCLAVCLWAVPPWSAPAEGRAEPSPAPPPSSAPASSVYALELTLEPGREGPPAEPNRAAEVHLRITPVPGWELKTTTPMNLKLSAAAPLGLPRATYTAADWVPKQGPAASRYVVAEIAIEAPGGGHRLESAEVSAQINFFLCSKTLCRRFVDRAAVMVPIEASATPPSPPSPPSPPLDP